MQLERSKRLFDEYMESPRQIFGSIAELVACVGPEVAKEVVIDLD